MSFATDIAKAVKDNLLTGPEWSGLLYGHVLKEDGAKNGILGDLAYYLQEKGRLGDDQQTYETQINDYLVGKNIIKPTDPEDHAGHSAFLRQIADHTRELITADDQLRPRMETVQQGIERVSTIAEKVAGENPQLAMGGLEAADRAQHYAREHHGVNGEKKLLSNFNSDAVTSFIRRGEGLDDNGLTELLMRDDFKKTLRGSHSAVLRDIIQHVPDETLTKLHQERKAYEQELLQQQIANGPSETLPSDTPEAIAKFKEFENQERARAQEIYDTTLKDKGIEGVYDTIKQGKAAQANQTPGTASTVETAPAAGKEAAPPAETEAPAKKSFMEIHGHRIKGAGQALLGTGVAVGSIALLNAENRRYAAQKAQAEEKPLTVWDRVKHRAAQTGLVFATVASVALAIDGGMGVARNQQTHTQRLISERLSSRATGAQL